MRGCAPKGNVNSRVHVRAAHGNGGGRMTGTRSYIDPVIHRTPRGSWREGANEAYRTLAGLKVSPRDSFSQVIKRHFRRSGRLALSAGAWSDVTDDDVRA